MGRAHLFWTQGDSELGYYIFYSYWNDNTWSVPVDILTSPIEGTPRYLDAVIDSSGNVYVLFFGGNDFDGRLYISQAPVGGLGSARSWSTPIEIANKVDPSGSITLMDDGTLQVLVAGQKVPQLFTLNSIDNGGIWTAPHIIYDGVLPGYSVSGITTTTDPSGVTHASWTLYDSKAFGQEVLYSKFDPNRGEWDEPTTLAAREPDDFGVGYSSLAAVDESKLIIIYQDESPPKRVFRVSANQGESWSDPRIAFGVIGQNGMVGPMALDNEGNLHVITHGRHASPGSPDVHGMFYAPWLGDYWGARSSIIEGHKINDFDPQNPTLISYGGNKLLAVYGNDPANGLWFSVAETSASPSEPKPYPTTPSQVAIPTELSATPIPTPEATPLSQSLSQPPNTSNRASSSLPLVIGSSLALILILILMITRFFKSAFRGT